ncbi:Oidioi.mRNA.OKI2018_I69.chr1.g1275.t1.cds [Oikopleura dioica]|uniref:Oidioi.mRNA.OKI2018_I69.chr1.g1275.t1.cds n=1 Tax=Oikopleura dioica TaxID=34765 RepID=A0ABN7SSF6_OIKDI|nr:Oidioi.mRNA.OKI2018_I69.chr1.g1275.t1.cds [Oikopleura dioica]
MKAFALFASASAWTSSEYATTYSYWDPSNMTCGGTITESTLLVIPTDENGFYYNDMDCHWDLQFPEDVSLLHVVPRNFAVEDCGSGCYCDALIVNANQTDESGYCGFQETSRRRRQAEKEYSLEGRYNIYNENSNNTGMDARTIVGNTGTIKWFTDGSVAYRGAEVCIYADGDDMEAVCPPPAPAAPATLSPADAWAQIEAAAADVATVVNDFYAALPGLGANSVLATKKVNRFNDFFAKMQKLNNHSSADACAYPAGSNDHSTFVSPVDSADGCEELAGLFASLASFLDSYVCLPSAESRSIKWTRLIQRQRKLVMTRKLKQMSCGN